MKFNFRHIIKERKLQLFFLMYTLLLVPSLSLIAQNIPTGSLIPGILVSLGLLIVIFALSSFLSTKNLRIFYSFLLAITLIPSAILLGYLLFAKVLLCDGSITTLFETNKGEAKEFVTYISPWLTIGIALYVLLPIAMIFKIKRVAIHRVSDHKKTFFACMLALLSILAIEPVAQRIYFVDFYRVYADYASRTQFEEKAIAERQLHPFDVQYYGSKAPHTLVVVIGESLSRHHMSLYGYKRPTNPQLSSLRANLEVYEDITSPQVHTISVLRSALTFADNEHPEYLIEKPSLFELFNRAGFETYLISNQPFENSSSSYEPLLKLAQHTTDLSKSNQPDGIMLNAFKQILNEETDKPKLIVLHLMGSHVAYKFRYPASYEFFNQRNYPIADNQPYLNSLEVIDQYDNSVRYNDKLIATIIDQLSHEKESSAMLYFSDHGEEVYDIRNFAGHAYEKASTYMCEVPFILWMSKRYKQQRSNDLVFDTSRPFSTTDLLYSVSDLAGLQYEGFDKSRSLFSVDFLPREREIGTLSYKTVQEMTEQAKINAEQDKRSLAAVKNLTLRMKEKVKEKVPDIR